MRKIQALPRTLGAWPAAALTVLVVVGMGCGPKHLLRDYSFANRSLAMVYIQPPAPQLLTSGYDLSDIENPIEAVVRAGSKVAKDVEARKASVRLDSAVAKVDLAGALANQTLERTSRYLGTRPVTGTDAADYLLEVHMRSLGIDARGNSSAVLYTNAEAVLLDRTTGREIWNINVHGTDRLTPVVRGNDQIPGAIIGAGTLATVTVEQFEQALEQLMVLSSNLIADELREALRDARRR
jgi:hypothetical protein